MGTGSPLVAFPATVVQLEMPELKGVLDPPGQAASP